MENALSIVGKFLCIDDIIDIFRCRNKLHSAANQKLAQMLLIDYDIYQAQKSETGENKLEYYLAFLVDFDLIETFEFNLNKLSPQKITGDNCQNPEELEVYEQIFVDLIDVILLFNNPDEPPSIPSSPQNHEDFCPYKTESESLVKYFNALKKFFGTDSFLKYYNNFGIIPKPENILILIYYGYLESNNVFDIKNKNSVPTIENLSEHFIWGLNSCFGPIFSEQNLDYIEYLKKYITILEDRRAPYYKVVLEALILTQLFLCIFDWDYENFKYVLEKYCPQDCLLPFEGMEKILIDSLSPVPTEPMKMYFQEYGTVIRKYTAEETEELAAEMNTPEDIETPNGEQHIFVIEDEDNPHCAERVPANEEDYILFNGTYMVIHNPFTNESEMSENHTYTKRNFDSIKNIADLITQKAKQGYKTSPSYNFLMEILSEF